MNAFSSTPSIRLRVMMLTTPPIASEPYTAEPPSFRISTRSTAAVGMVFRSTAVPAPTPPLTMRLPSTSTSVRCEPRSRRFTCVSPSPPLFTLVFSAPPCSGCCWRNSPIVATPLAVIWSRLITETGAGVVRSLRRTREPVTTISSSPALRPTGPGVVDSGTALGGAGTGFACGVCSAGVPCAMAVPEMATDSRAISRSPLYFRCMFSSCCYGQLLRVKQGNVILDRASAGDGDCANALGSFASRARIRRRDCTIAHRSSSRGLARRRDWNARHARGRRSRRRASMARKPCRTAGALPWKQEWRAHGRRCRVALPLRGSRGSNGREQE